MWKCICVWLGRVGGGECVSGLGLGFTNLVGRGGVWKVCVFGSRWMGGVGGWFGLGCGVVLRLCVCCEIWIFVEMAGQGICVLCSVDIWSS